MPIDGKKVLVLCTTDSMIWNFLIPHIHTLEEAGCQVECACAKTGFYFEELERMFHLKMNELPIARSPYNLKNIKAYKRLIHLLKEKNFDVIHCHEPMGGVLGRLTGKKCGKYVIYTVHGFHFYKGAPFKNWMLYYNMERYLSRYTNILITMNQEDYSNAGRLQAQKVYQIHGIGIDMKKFCPDPLQRNEVRKTFHIGAETFLVVSVGELIWRKNYPAAIRAFAAAKIEDSVLLICGEGPLREETEQLCRRLRIEHKVVFAGFRKDISKILRAADMFLFPSYQEGLPMAVMEAMASGVPIVASDIRGNNDLIHDGKNGRLILPDNVKEMGKAIRELYENPLERVKMAKKSRKVIEMYSLENVQQELKTIYHEMDGPTE